MYNVTEMFGSMVFGDSVMQARLPKKVYLQVQQTIKLGKRLDRETADVVANAMKDWAIEKGVTHFTHWFQPMTGITAEKHDSFISPAQGGRIIMEFSGKELIQGEPDASSFPNGGLRATFEARGYTAWDPTSYAFIKDGVLCIPTAFCSYGGEALDKKTPLLRSMEAINRQCMRVLKLFGNEDVTTVKTTVGPEQEYFLVDKAMFDKRPDLKYTGRTLFGARPPKSQELDDHYFGAIKPRVAAFMRELDEELWRLGVLSKTEHNEAAPAQHELAPIYSTTNISADHNQITMELMQKLARKFDMECLLHEKPFEGINGSGKHNNWSISTDTGINLFEPGETPYENAQFLLLLCAVMQAVDDYQDMLRISVTSAANDHRLGATEAPPAIVSMYLGEELETMLNCIERDECYGSRGTEQFKVGVHALPRFPKDITDRNRTTPFAFTGNKFEFRMLGSSSSISGANVVINTAVAESLRQYADILEKAEDFEAELHRLIREVVKKHKHIVFNGNGYGEDWVKEAEKRGLLNLPSTPDCVPYYLDIKNVELFARHRVYSEIELAARYKMKLDSYSKTIRIEALTMLDMLRHDILPAVSGYAKTLCDNAESKVGLGLDTSYERETAGSIGKLTQKAYALSKELDARLSEAEGYTDVCTRARAYHDKVLSEMENLRSVVDGLELLTARDCWPYPSVGEILFSVR